MKEIFMITEEELRAVVRDEVTEAIRAAGISQARPEMVEGIEGICKLFNVSKTKAYKLRNGVIRKAVTQHGRVIRTDVKLAEELFYNQNHTEG